MRPRGNRALITATARDDPRNSRGEAVFRVSLTPSLRRHSARCVILIDLLKSTFGKVRESKSSLGKLKRESENGDGPREPAPCRACRPCAGWYAANNVSIKKQHPRGTPGHASAQMFTT